jgi:hypothetical protein
MNTTEIIKLQLSDFFERLSISKKTNLFSEIQPANFNKELFRIEEHLHKLKKQYRLNQNIDCSIVSESILKSIENYKESFKSDDYLLSFLVFLSKQKTHDAEKLKVVMDNYVDLVKIKFSINDVLISASGAKRCFTNLRFALNQLRKLGLVYSTTEVNNHIVRTFRPTSLGYLVAMSVCNLTDNDVIDTLEDNTKEKKYDFYKTIRDVKVDTETCFASVIDKFSNIPADDYSHVFNEIREFINNKETNRDNN